MITLTRTMQLIFVTIIVLFVIITYWTLTGYPSVKAMLGSVIPPLTGPEEIKLEQGFKAIHVKIKPEGWIDSELILYEFHPTNEGALGRKHFSAIGRLTASPDVNDFFFLKKFENDKCYLFTTKFKDGLLGYDIDSWIYMVSPGSKILQSSSTMVDSDNIMIEKDGCNPQEECKDMTPEEFTVCRDYYTGILDPFNQKANCADDDAEKLKEQQFAAATDNCIYDEEGCPSIDGKKDCCVLAKYDNNKHAYAPAYNIVCASEIGSGEARWYACTGNQNSRLQIGNTQFTCNKATGEWVVESGSGISIMEPYLKYDADTLGFHHTDLKFALANNQNNNILNVKITASITDPSGSIDCKVAGITTDCTTLSKSYSAIDANENKEFNSHGLSCAVTQGDFCYKAKTFSVKIDYNIKENNVDASKTKNYLVDCKNANPDKEDWVKCNAQEILGGAGDTTGTAGGTSCPTNVVGYMCTDSDTCSKFGGSVVSGTCPHAGGWICCKEPSK